MKEELEQKLYDEFPSLFADRTLPDTKSLMCYGLEVGDGWYNIIHRLCTKIVSVDSLDNFRFFQIKQKFGKLRVYADGGPREIYDFISMAEVESSKTCERCGSVSDVKQTGRWIETLCASCRENK
jgi:hypothetical protein